MNFFVRLRSGAEASQGLVLGHSKGVCTMYSPQILKKERGQATKSALFNAVLFVTFFPIAGKPSGKISQAHTV